MPHSPTQDANTLLQRPFAAGTPITVAVEYASRAAALTQPGSTWFAARERGEDFIDATEVAADTSYRKAL